MWAKARRKMAMLALACGACLDMGQSADDDTTMVTPARLLDDLCAQNAYTLDGTAARIAGPTPDSCAFELGPGPSSLSFPIDGSSELEAARNSDATVSVLVLELDAAGAAPAWTILDNSGVAWGSTAPSSPVLTYAPNGRHVAVLDIRVSVTYSTGEGCSVAPRTRRPLRPGLVHTRRSWTPMAS
jgi:hypothetical protein